ncbi:VOC family protein [Streptomyces sp. NPDC003027]|uniref:Glyoxalase/fosfomycin resistance/dioxygenase domain-containing protein n=1 Tax=uncultured soil bacterium V167 TaxID=684592 RepID=D3U1W2_9BACT|nr:hypothetical [uncultured soil bacterium V167]
MTPSSFGKFAVLAIKTRDLPAMTAFYRDVLGLEPKAAGETFSAFHTGAGGELVLWNDAAGPFVPGFAGADLEAAREALLDAKPTEIEDHPGGKHFYLTDPDGNTIAFSNG